MASMSLPVGVSSACSVMETTRTPLRLSMDWFWTTTAICHGGKSDGLAFRQRPDGNGIEVKCHTGGCSAGVVITELEALIGLPIWTAYAQVTDAPVKAPEKQPWWKRKRVVVAGAVVLVVAAPLLRRFMPRRPVGRVRRR